MIKRFVTFCFLFILLPLQVMVAQSKVKNDTTSLFDKIISLEGVTVTAEQTNRISGLLSGDISLNPASLHTLPSLAGDVDLLKILELTPSVRTSGDGNSNIYIRGGDAGQNLILYNGIPCYTPGHALGVFPLFNSHHISSLQLIKNGVHSAYGNHLSAVIDVESKSTIPRKFNATGNVGLLASQLTLSIPITKKWGVYASGRVSYISLFLEPLIRSLSSNDSTDMSYDYWDTNLTLIGQLNRKNKLQIDVLMGQDKVKLDDEESLIDGFLKWRNRAVSAQLNTRLTNNTVFNQTLYGTFYENKLFTEQGQMYIDLNSRITNWGYRNKITRYRDRMSVSGGLNYERPEVKPHRLRMVNLDVPSSPLREQEQSAHSLSLFASTEGYITDRLQYMAGLRYNWFWTQLNTTKQKQLYHNMDVRLQLQYQLTHSTYIKGAYSHNNQYINKLSPSSIGLPTDFWVLSNPAIRPQLGNNYSLGTYTSFDGGNYEVSLEAYYRNMNGLTEFDYNFTENDDTSYLEKIKFGKGDAYGVELMLKKNFGKLTGWFSYAWGKTNRRFDEIDGGAKFPARFDRRHDVSLFLNYEFSKKWNLSLNQVFATGNTYTQPTSWYVINDMPVKEYTKYNNARLPNYIRTDWNLSYSISKNHTISLSCYNAMGRKNPLYVFFVLRQDEDNPENPLEMRSSRKRLYTFLPSINWSFKF